MKKVKHVQLSDIAELITKGTTPTTIGYEFVSEGVNFLKIECFDENGAFIKDKVTHITEECHEKLKRSQLRDGDILFSIAGAIGRVAIVTEEMLPANTNQALAIIRINRDSIYLPYIRLILTSPIVWRQFEKRKQGVAQLNLSLKDINELTIPLPSFEEQIKYSDLFSKVSAVIENRKIELNKYDELIKARFLEMFGDPVINQYGWVQTTLNEVACGKLSYGSGASAIEYDGIVRYVRITDINDKGELDSDSKSPDKYDDKYLLNDGDILFARSGATVGKTFRYSKVKYGKCIYAGYLIRLIPDTTKVLPDYVYWYTKTSYYSSFVEKVQRAVAQPNINAQEYGSLIICVPPLELQKQFVLFVKQVDKSKYVVQKLLNETILLFNSLMQEYFG